MGMGMGLGLGLGGQGRGFTGMTTPVGSARLGPAGAAGAGDLGDAAGQRASAELLLLQSSIDKTIGEVRGKLAAVERSLLK